MKAILTVGIPGSGKTTWAEEQKSFVNINRDDIRMKLFELENYSDYKFTKDRENQVTTYMDGLIHQCSAEGVDIIISDTNLNKSRRENLTRFLSDLCYDVEIKDSPIDFWTAVKRDEKRNDKTVGRQVIYRMYQSWLKYSDRKTYTPDLSLPDAYIFDSTQDHWGFEIQFGIFWCRIAFCDKRHVEDL